MMKSPIGYCTSVRLSLVWNASLLSCHLDPGFRSILSLTLSWNKWLVWRTIHKYERFFSDKKVFLAISPVLWNVRFLNCLVEVPQLHMESKGWFVNQLLVMSGSTGERTVFKAYEWL
jgi:hypothetical protein